MVGSKENGENQENVYNRRSNLIRIAEVGLGLALIGMPAIRTIIGLGLVADGVLRKNK